MSAGPDRFWTLVDEAGRTRTYEHRMPHGVLIRVETVAYANMNAVGNAEALVFVPNPPTMEPYR